jgi:hypothetical protein
MKSEFTVEHTKRQPFYPRIRNDSPARVRAEDSAS